MQKQEFAVGWFTLSMVIAGIAQGKNRSGLGWWLFGLILGPIALVILLFLDRGTDYSGMEERLASRISDEMRRLPRGPANPG